MRVRILSLGRRSALDALMQNDIDMALGFAWDIPRSIRQIDLYQEDYCVVLRQDHPLAGNPLDLLDLDAYCAADHLVVSLKGICGALLMKSWRKLADHGGSAPVSRNFCQPWPFWPQPI